MRTVTVSIAMALLTALTLSASVLAGDQLPMTGQYTIGVAPVEQRCGPNALTIGFEGVGIATHLGRMTGTGSNCTEFTLATESVAIWDGVATYMAADGSKRHRVLRGRAGRAGRGRRRVLHDQHRRVGYRSV